MGLLQRIRADAAFLYGTVRVLRRVRKAATEEGDRTIVDIVEEFARKTPDSPAIIFDNRTWTYGEFNAAANQYARWAQSQGIGRGDVVALMMENRPEYLIAWLGIIKVGGIAALINTNLSSQQLAYSLGISGARYIVLGAELAENYATAVDQLDSPIEVWATGGKVQGSHDLDEALESMSGAPLGPEVRAAVTMDDKCLYIYTSGTTGNPKAANITHRRIKNMMIGFAALTNAKAKDRMMIVLPLYHSAGGVCAVGIAFMAGGSVIIRQRFSVSSFWEDAVRFEATLFQYIGELCRYLLNGPQNFNENLHQIRLAVGNGLRPDIWEDFKKRFRIPKVVEFYGATEGNVALFNQDGSPGAVGRIPRWASKASNVDIVRFDIETETPVRGVDGFCIRCEPNEVGEMIGQIDKDPDDPTTRFEGYADSEATERKILRNVFQEGDMWFRTGDLLQQDERGYFYFVDRIGDTFRWKGENVATSEVAEVLSVFPGVQEANVYGVEVPGADGRAGMVSLVVESNPDFTALQDHLNRELASYARPVFLRLQKQIGVTGTFKHRKVDLVAEGYDPENISDPLYFRDPETDKFIPLDTALHGRITRGDIRL
ncbi:MAG: long-chain-acyl-CoA synthetase [Parvularculales bacterium]